MQRRDFLRQLGAASSLIVGAGLFEGCQQTTVASPSATARAGYQLGPWTGDSFKPMHRIRDGYHPRLPPPSEKVDVVIVGGGLAGLSAAYHLKDLNVLLLERESSMGGNAKSGEWQGVEYGLGSAYLCETDEPFGPLYEELQLPLKPIPIVDSVWENERFVAVEESRLAASRNRLRKHLQKMLDGADFPNVPLHKASSKAMELDRLSLHDYLKADYPDLLDYADSYCWAAMGGGCQTVSAFYGLNGLSEICAPIYAFPGGNALLAKSLADGFEDEGADRMRGGCSVYRIETAGKRVRVGYFGSAAESPEPRCVEARAVIAAVPYFFAASAVADIPAAAAEWMRGLHYGAYMVANFCFDRPVFSDAATGGYDYWGGSGEYTDFVDANRVAGELNKPTVLTMYAPFQDAIAGRLALFKGDRQELAARVVKALAQRVKFAPETLAEVRLTRYGHQLLTSGLGLAGHLKDFPKRFGNVFLAHSDGQGMAAVESALLESHLAAREVRKQLGS